ARRRHCANPDHQLSHFLKERQIAEAEARFFQFHEQLLFVLSKQPNPAALQVSEAFRFLPPAGMAPVRTILYPIGVNVTNFFQGRSFGTPAVIAGDQLGALFLDSLRHAPIDLDKSGFVQLYSVSENSEAQSQSNP